jgi:hypothetical protein
MEEIHLRVFQFQLLDTLSTDIVQDYSNESISFGKETKRLVLTNEK